MPSAALAADPWWRGVFDRPKSARYLLEQVLGGPYRLARLGPVDLVTTATQDAIDELWRQIWHRASEMSWPAPESQVRAMVDELGARLGPGFGTLLYEQLEPWLVWV